MIQSTTRLSRGGRHRRRPPYGLYGLILVVIAACVVAVWFGACSGSGG